jgi:hypothetical protein
MENAVRTGQSMAALAPPVAAALYLGAEGLDPKGTDQTSHKNGGRKVTITPTKDQRALGRSPPCASCSKGPTTTPSVCNLL